MKKYRALFFTIISMLIFSASSPVDASTTFTNGRIKYDWEDVLVRECASSNCGRVKTKTGVDVKLDYPDTFKILGESGNYYYVETYFSGYVFRGYATKKYIETATYTTDDNYKNSLISKGFPEDYAERLAQLHAIHPNWTFTPSKTGDLPNGMDFNYAVGGETKDVFTNLVNGSDISLRSTEPGAYNENGWITTSGGWYAASPQTVAFFMDPRNFLDETFIFMFENLSYDKETQTEDVINKIVDGTFMQYGFTCDINSNSCTPGKHSYSEAFLQAGINKGLSPVSLAIRVLQEQGYDGSTLSSGNGYNGQYVGYYNLFNVYANGDSTEEVILNGLSYAHKMNWNNPYASIISGAALLGDKYISVGQNTLYYQKFDTVGTVWLFEHQYMQNVKAPYSESYNTYTNYRKSNIKNGVDDINYWNDSKFNFIIPIYSNMPLYTSLSEKASNDNTLKSLNVTNCSINPSFDPNALKYDCYVKNEVTSVIITGEATNKYAKVEGFGTVNVSSDNITKNIIITAADGSKRTIAINIHKLPKTEIKIDTTELEEVIDEIPYNLNGTYITNFKIGEDISVIAGKLKNFYSDSHIKINGSGIVKTGNTIEITVNNKKKTYTIILYGDATGDGKVNTADFAKMKQHLLGTATLTGAKLKALDLSKDGKVNTVDFAKIKQHLLGTNIINQG